MRELSAADVALLLAVVSALPRVPDAQLVSLRDAVVSELASRDAARRVVRLVSGGELERTLAAVSASTGVSRDEIVGRSRARRVVLARWLVIGELRALGWSYSRIGQTLGLDHSSVIYAARRVGVGTGGSGAAEEA